MQHARLKPPKKMQGGCIPVSEFRHVYFTPEDDVKAIVDHLPEQATFSLDLEIYGLTDMDLITTIITAHQRNIKVRVMNDRSQAAGPHDHVAVQALVDAGVTVKIVESEKGAIDHLKNIIIDGEMGALDNNSSVFYGSYNFSRNAGKQDNFAIWTNHPSEVAHAQAKFEHDWVANRQENNWQVLPSKKPEAT